MQRFQNWLKIMCLDTLLAVRLTVGASMACGRNSTNCNRLQANWCINVAMLGFGCIVFRRIFPDVPELDPTPSMAKIVRAYLPGMCTKNFPALPIPRERHGLLFLCWAPFRSIWRWSLWSSR